MINTKLLVQQLNNFMKGSTAASEARVQVKLPKGELYSVDGYFDIKRISLLQNNLIGYLPTECMPTEYIFADYDNILIVKDDSGNYYAPNFGVAILDEMCPGEGYEIFLTGTNDIELFYPSGDMARTHSEQSEYWADYRINSVSTQYDIAKTGISHPIIITELTGSVDVGDELSLIHISEPTRPY